MTKNKRLSVNYIPLKTNLKVNQIGPALKGEENEPKTFYVHFTKEQAQAMLPNFTLAASEWDGFTLSFFRDTNTATITTQAKEIDPELEETVKKLIKLKKDHKKKYSK
ncbi:hypothetical protein ACSU64_27935 [Bacillaceae bacterium C204]|uniref:hypothetical protein n=1 Tax=Neobacillus sp. 204 TaxID=3383351 RepID=UPI00397BA4A3